MIEVKHIDKSFGDKAVLRDINAVFDDGKTNLIIGQSGAGKTVLMKILVGLPRSDGWRGALRRARLCAHVEARARADAPRDGHDLPERGPLRLPLRPGECALSP